MSLPPSRERAVGYVLDHYPVLSQTFVTNEIQELRRRGRRVVIAAIHGGEILIDDDPDLLVVNREGAIDHPSHRRQRALARLEWSIRAPIAFARWWRSEPRRASVPMIASHFRRHDVGWVHAHFAWQGAAHAVGVTRLLDVPMSMTVHAKDIFVPKDDLGVKLAQVRRLVSVCDYNDRWMDENLPWPRPATTRVVCGVATTPEPIARPPEHDLLTVARLVPKKGIDLLVAAMVHIRAARPGTQLTIIGDGPERDALEGQVREAGLNDAVIFAGAVPHDEVLVMLERAAVFVLPARIAADGDRDSMPVVIKEAMMRGIPTVATDIVAIPEMIDHTVGRLVPPEDVAALADAAIELLGDPDLRAQLGRRARQRALKHFTLGQNIGVLDGIWAETLAAGR